MYYVLLLVEDETMNLTNRNMRIDVDKDLKSVSKSVFVNSTTLQGCAKYVHGGSVKVIN